MPQVEARIPGYIAVGDDSGGRLILIRQDDDDAVPYLADAGALLPSILQPLAPNWIAWEKIGFPLPID